MRYVSLEPSVFLFPSTFLGAVSGAYLRYGNTRLDDSLPSVTMTVGKTESVFCMHFTEPAPAGIMWYDPQDRLVSGSSGDAVYQFMVLMVEELQLSISKVTSKDKGGRMSAEWTVVRR